MGFGHSPHYIVKFIVFCYYSVYSESNWIACKTMEIQTWGGTLGIFSALFSRFLSLYLKIHWEKGSSSALGSVAFAQILIYFKLASDSIGSLSLPSIVSEIVSPSGIRYKQTVVCLRHPVGWELLLFACGSMLSWCLSCIRELIALPRQHMSHFILCSWIPIF